jgi:hypothetical protein
MFIERREPLNDSKLPLPHNCGEGLFFDIEVQHPILSIDPKKYRTHPLNFQKSVRSYI